MSSIVSGLPAGLRHARNHTGISKFAESDTREMEATQECVTTPRQLAAVHLANRGSIARKHCKTNIVALSLQLGAEVCIASRDSCLLFVSFYPAFLSHNFVGALCTSFREESQALFSTFCVIFQFRARKLHHI